MPNTEDRKNFEASTRAGDVEEVRRLIRAGAGTANEALVRASGSQLGTALTQAMLHDGADVHFNNDAALQVAANNPARLKQLLEAGADVHAQNEGALWRVVSLAYAVGRNRQPDKQSLECARLLLAHGANPLARHPLANGDSILEHQTGPAKIWTGRTGPYPDFPVFAGSFVAILLNSLPPLSLDDAKRVERICGRFRPGPGFSFKIPLTPEAQQQLEKQQIANGRRAATRAKRAGEYVKRRSEEAEEVLRGVPLPPDYSVTVRPHGIIIEGPFSQTLLCVLRNLRGQWDPEAKQWVVALQKAAKLAEAFHQLAAAQE